MLTPALIHNEHVRWRLATIAAFAAAIFHFHAAYYADGRFFYFDNKCRRGTFAASAELFIYYAADAFDFQAATGDSHNNNNGTEQ